MNDPHGARPALPDPQRDRHVSFPDDPPNPDPVTSGATLPPEAWAPRSTDPGPQQRRAPSWHDPAAPPTFTTPPARQATQRRLPGWVALFLVPPLLLGVANVGSSGSMTEDCTYSSGAGPLDCFEVDGSSSRLGDPAPGDGVPGVWVQEITGSTSFAPVVTGKPQVLPCRRRPGSSGSRS